MARIFLSLNNVCDMLFRRNSVQFVSVVLFLILDHSASKSETCKEFIDRMKLIEYSTLQSKENYFQRLDAKLIVNNTYDVTFTCINDYKLIGMTNIKCFNNGSWSHNTPTCLEQCFDLNTLENMEITTTNRTLNTTLNLKCRLPKYKYEGPTQLVCKHGGWHKDVSTKLPRKDYPKCTLIPQYTSWKRYLIIAGSVCGGVVTLIIALSICIWTRRRHGKEIDDEGKRDPASLRSKYCFKVWSADRQKKKLIVAEDLNSLRASVCLEFGVNGIFILEEDGTEIENNELLYRFNDKTLMVLGKHEKWQNSRSRMQKNGGSSAFHVFTHDRENSAMILCFSLNDLCEQAFHMFGYKPQYMCFETDGTWLETDQELMAFAGSRLMAIKSGTFWTKPQSGKSAQDNILFSSADEKCMYNVWSKDGRKRKHVFAENIVALHYSAANVLGLRPPVEITTMKGVVISDDHTLAQQKNEVLLATEVMPSKKINLKNESCRDSSVYSA